MEEIEITVKVHTDEKDLEKAKENATAVVSSKLAMANSDKGFEDGKIYEINGVSFGETRQ
jgi:hypothetical protein